MKKMDERSDWLDGGCWKKRWSKGSIQKWEKIKKNNWVLKEDLESDNLVDQQSSIISVM